MYKRGAAWCRPVPTPFGGSFGGKSVRQILIRAAQINAQLWSHIEKCRYLHRRVLASEKPYEPVYNFILQQEVVRKPTIHHPRTPPLSPRETPLFGRVRTASAMGADYPTASQSAPFCGALPLPERLHESSFIFGLCCKPSTQPDDPVRFCRAFPARVSYAHHPDLQRGHP